MMASNQVLDMIAVQKDRAQTSKGYPFKTFDEMAIEATAKRWLIKGIFARGESSAWIAPPGGMKSALMAQASICVAAGFDWNGHRSKETAGVVYFAFERADLVRRRLQAHGVRQDLTGLPIAVVNTPFDLTKPDSFTRVVDTIRDAERHFGCSMGLGIFDTFAKLISAGGGDENSAKDQGLVFASLQRIKNNTDIHVAIVGHTGKDENRGMRGSNAALGDVDMMVTVSGDLIRTATVTKANDAPEGPLFSFKSDIHEFGTDEDGDPVSVNVVSGERIESAKHGAHRTNRWTKGLKLVHDAIAEAAINCAIDHRVAGNGPIVKAVAVSAARAVHNQRYVSNGDGDRAEAERKAWARNFKQAREASLVGGELKDGQELIWLAV